MLLSPQYQASRTVIVREAPAFSVNGTNSAAPGLGRPLAGGGAS